MEINISKKLNTWFEAFCETKVEYKTISSDYTRKKVHLNGVQFVSGFQSFSGKDNTSSWEDYIGIPIAIELVMIWAYKSNQIIDNKKDVWSKNGKVKESVLAHDIILSCIFDILENFQPELKEKNILVNHYILSFVKDIPLGFLIEKQKLNINHASLKKILIDWEENYIKRNIFFNSLYDITPMLGYYIASGIDVIPKYKEDIAPENRFSHVGQIINDLSDCIPMHDLYVKTYQDQFSDIKNGIVTYPIYSIYKQNPQLITEVLGVDGGASSQKWQDDFFQEFKKQELSNKIKSISIDSYNKHVDFWNSILQRDNDFISRTYGLLRDNKYFITFEKNNI